MDSGLVKMIDTRKDAELKQAFILITHHEPSLKLFALELEPYIKKRGEAMYNDETLKKDPRSKF